MEIKSLIRCIEITGSDTRLDNRSYTEPTNPLPKRCLTCDFPDVEVVPQPYFLIRGRAMSPNEIAMAEMGNLLVKRRVRQILDLVATNQCEFYPTCYAKTTETTDWQLAVPLSKVRNGVVKDEIKRCPACLEPASAHPGSEWKERRFPPFEANCEIAKGMQWGSEAGSWKIWMSRDCFMSVRLFWLLKQVGIQGINEATCKSVTKPSEEESFWIKAKLDALRHAGISMNSPGTCTHEELAWFKSILKGRKSQAGKIWDGKVVRRDLGVTLPKTYLEFINAIGTACFPDSPTTSENKVRVLDPSEIDNTSFRTGRRTYQDQESQMVDGVVFAEDGLGDQFCFDIKPGVKEYQVYRYLHDYDYLELFAETFPGCIRRFMEGDHG